jgi:hypothetical protein
VRIDGDIDRKTDRDEKKGKNEEKTRKGHRTASSLLSPQKKKTKGGRGRKS